MDSKKSSSDSEQLMLSFGAVRGLPFAVSPRRVRRAARRQLHAAAPAELAKLELVETVRELRRRYRAEVRERGNAAAYASSPEGRRAHAAIDDLVIALCG